MDLIDQFFTLAKLEAGDMDIDLGRIDICEVCRENVLGFYDILLQKGFEVDLSIPETPVFVQGNGLGLTIAKGLAVQMGEIFFLDSTPDVKTTFTIKLKKNRILIPSRQPDLICCVCMVKMIPKFFCQGYRPFILGIPAGVPAPL